MSFELDKKNILTKIDKSKIGKIDSDIKEICSLINSKKDYYTTSSCSGRIVLLESNSSKKNESKWLFVSHDLTEFEQIKKIQSNSDVWFRQEGAILHVCCKDLKSAEKLINLVKSIGFKRAGMISVNNRYVIEIISSEHLCTIVIKNGKKIVSDEYLSALIDEANTKMKQNQDKLNNLSSRLRLR